MKLFLYAVLLLFLAGPLPAQFLQWSFPDQRFLAGDTVTVPVSVTGFDDIGAFQYALRYDTAVLRFDPAQPFTFTGALPYSPDCFSHGLMAGIWQPTNLLPNEIRTAWAEPGAATVPDGTHIYSLHFIARRAGTVCASLEYYAGGLLQPEAWRTDLATAVPQSAQCMAAQARKVRKIAPDDRAECCEPIRADIYLGGRLTIYPNPVTDTTTITVDLQQPQPILINVLDASGYTVFGCHYQHPGDGGWQYQVDFPAAPGIYFVVVDAGQGSRFIEKVSKL